MMPCSKAFVILGWNNLDSLNIYYYKLKLTSFFKFQQQLAQTADQDKNIGLMWWYTSAQYMQSK